MLGWSQDDLAKAARIGLGTLKRIEAGEGEIGGRQTTAAALVAALIAAGVTFDLSHGSGPGVRLTEP